MKKEIEVEKVKLFELLISPKGLLAIIITFAVIVTLIVLVTVYFINKSQEQEDPLSAPNITLAEKTLRWGFVDGASKYIIYINDEEHDRTNYNQYYIGNLGPGTYVFSIASSNNEKISPKSNEITYRID